MRIAPVAEIKAKFSAYLKASEKGPIVVTRNGKAVAVLLSVEDYQRLDAAADAWWAERAREAAKDGFAGAKASRKLLRDMLNAEDQS